MSHPFFCISTRLRAQCLFKQIQYLAAIFGHIRGGRRIAGILIAGLTHINASDKAIARRFIGKVQLAIDHRHVVRRLRFIHRYVAQCFIHKRNPQRQRQLRAKFATTQAARLVVASQVTATRLCW